MTRCQRLAMFLSIHTMTRAELDDYIARLRAATQTEPDEQGFLPCGVPSRIDSGTFDSPTLLMTDIMASKFTWEGGEVEIVKPKRPVKK